MGVFKTKVKEKVDSGATRKDALEGAKAGMERPLNKRETKRYDRSMKRLTKPLGGPGVPPR